MAFTVSFLGANVDLAENAALWTTGALDPDKFVQGTNSLGWYGAKNALRSNTVTPAASVAWSTGDHLYFWANCDVASKLEPQTTGTTTRSGLCVLVTLSNGATADFHVAGSDTWDGGWRCFVVDLGHTGTQRYATSGTFSSASNIASVTFYYDLSNSGNIRNVPANIFQDAIRVGTGLQAYNTSAADPSFDFTDIAAQDELVANKWGVLQIIDGVVFSQGYVECGQTTTNHLDFDSQNEVFVFTERDGGDGYGFVADALYGLLYQANVTGTDQDVNFGIKVGTGDGATGRNGTIVRASSSAVVYDVIFAYNNTLMHNVTIYGSTFQGATGTAGVTCDNPPTTTHEVIGCTFDGCEQLDFNDAVQRNNVILNSATVSTSGALTYDETDTDIKNCLFVNNSNAIEMAAGSVTGDVTFVGMEFQGNTYDVRNENTSGTYNLNWSDAPAAPTINNTGGQTLTAQNTVTLTLLNVVVGSQCSIHTDPGGVELMNEAAVATTVTESYAYTAAQDVIVRVRKASADPKYRPYDTPGQITEDGLTVFVSQVPALS